MTKNDEERKTWDVNPAEQSGHHHQGGQKTGDERWNTEERQAEPSVTGEKERGGRVRHHIDTP